MQAAESMSSTSSNRLPFLRLPSAVDGGKVMSGSSIHFSMVDSGMPLANRALPKESSDGVVLSQLHLSANPSSGDADACTALLPVLGSKSKPSSLYLQIA